MANEAADGSRATGGAAPIGPLDRVLRDLTDDQRRQDAVTARRREQWLRRQNQEDGTLLGVFTDLAEHQRALTIQTVAGRSVRGQIRSLGSDFVGLDGPSTPLTVVAVAAVIAILPEPGASPTVGARNPSRGTTLAGELSVLAADTPPVTVHTVSGERMAGRLWWAGQDVVAVRRSDQSDAYIALHAINDVVLS